MWQIRQSQKVIVVPVWLNSVTSLKSEDRFSSFDLVFSFETARNFYYKSFPLH